MKALDLALCLGMSNSAPMQANALAHQPKRQARMPGRRQMSPPRRAVIHQHAFGNSTALKSFLKLLPHRFSMRTAIGGERDQIATVIVEHGKRSDRLRP